MRVLEREGDRVAVDDVDMVDEGVDRTARQMVLRVEHAVEVDLHGFGVKRRAVVKAHVVLELEDVAKAVRTHFNRFGEIRHRVHVAVELHEAFVDGAAHGLRDCVGRVVGVERREGGRERNGDFLCVCGCGGECA